MLFRVGILTFHRADNYGAVLQAMALQEAINQLGAEGFIIDYYPHYMRTSNCMISTQTIGMFLRSIRNFPSKYKKHCAFNQFRKNLLNIIGKNLDSFHIQSVGNMVDMLALGSDQIWNPNITNGVDPVYYGKIGEKSMKAFSYAASVGVSSLTAIEKNIILRYISDLNKVSVREAEVLELLNLKNGTVVCDPVLLHTDNFWRNRLKLNTRNEKYILIYALTGYKETYDMGRLLKKETGLRVIEIRNTMSYKKEIPGEKILRSISPKDFVELFDNATYVVTDSFHGTAFSIIFEKDAFVIPNKEKGGRMISLMKQLKLSNRIIDSLEKVSINTINQTVDMNYMKRKRDELRLKSLEYLKDSIFE